MRLLLVLTLLMITARFNAAGDYCFVQPHAAKSYDNYKNAQANRVDVINQQLQLQPAKAHQIDTIAEQIFALEYQKVLEAIPLTPRKQVAPLRRFEFKNNTPAYVVKQQVQKQQNFQTETVTQTFQAVVQQSIVVGGDNVVLDGSPHILNKIIKPVNQK